MSVNHLRPLAESLQNMTQENALFFSLVRPKLKAKQKPCLKCKVPFAASTHNRICSSCNEQNKKMSINAHLLTPDH